MRRLGICTADSSLAGLSRIEGRMRNQSGPRSNQGFWLVHFKTGCRVRKCARIEQASVCYLRASRPRSGILHPVCAVLYPSHSITKSVTMARLVPSVAGLRAVVARRLGVLGAPAMRILPFGMVYDR